MEPSVWTHSTLVDPVELRRVSLPCQWNACPMCSFVTQGRKFRRSRHDRLYPGEGELWLDDILDAMPLGIPISIEVPRIIHANCSVRDRAKLAGDALRLYLARYRDRASHVSIDSGSVHRR